MIYNDGSTSTLYYYVLNAQGDVIALLNANGTLAASYNYGAWGNYSVHGADGKKTTDATFIGHINPLRYRGYYYDRETRLYYLQSRYYDFANCRFINADTFATTDANGFLSANMFAYCENNPVNYSDANGRSFVSCLLGGIVGLAASVAIAKVAGSSGWDLALAAIEGFITGAITRSDVALIIGATFSVINGVITGIRYKSVSAGIAVATTSFVLKCISSNGINMALGEKLGAGASRAFDSTIGFGMGISSAALDSGIKSMVPSNIKTATNGGANGVIKTTEKESIRRAIEEVKIGPGRTQSWMPWR